MPCVVKNNSLEQLYRMMFNHGLLSLAAEQVSEEVERALAKLGSANLTER